MKNSNLQCEGRINYVEPNDYNGLPNGIPHPYEDYCISVDFTVEFGDRNSCGVAGYNSGDARNEVLTFSSDRGTINFIGGTNGFLTTNFTDIESTHAGARLRRPFQASVPAGQTAVVHLQQLHLLALIATANGLHRAFLFW